MRDWHEHSYRPIAQMIREEKVLDAFPNRTEMDLNFWIVNHREHLALEALDESVTPSTAKEDILRHETGRRIRRRLGPDDHVNIYG